MPKIRELAITAIAADPCIPTHCPTQSVVPECKPTNQPKPQMALSDSAVIQLKTQLQRQIGAMLSA